MADELTPFIDAIIQPVEGGYTGAISWRTADCVGKASLCGIFLSESAIKTKIKSLISSMGLSSIAEKDKTFITPRTPIKETIK